MQFYLRMCKKMLIEGEPFGNLQSRPKEWHDHSVMAHFPQSQSKKRSPRVRVPNDEMVRFNIDGAVVPGVLQRLSLTGGLAEFPTSVGAGNIAEVQLNTTLGPVSGLVEFLRQQKGGSMAHPFRFIALGDGDYKRLNATLQLMRRLGLGLDAN